MCALVRLVSVFALVAISSVVSAAPLTLVEDGRSDYQIVLPAKASPSEQRGARELQGHIEKMAGAKLAIVDDGGALPARAILIGNTKHTPSLLKDGANAGLGPEGFRLRTAGPHLVIFGSNVRGAMYGCTALLEKLGVRWYTAKVTFTPYRRTLSVPDLDETHTPAFEYRSVYVTEALDTDFAARMRLNGHHHPLKASEGGRIRYSHFAHTFDEIYPRDRFKEHPEFFPLIKGQRTNGYVQRCLSNPEFLKHTIARVRAWIETDPDALIHSVTQNDTGKWCQCDQCTAIARQYGGVQSGLYLWFVNRVAEEIEKTNPNVLIDTFAYQFTEAPPTGIKPRKNVRIRLCPIAACAAHPFEQCTFPATVAFLKHLDGWSKITDTLYIWHYNTSFAHYLMPYPDFGEFPADTRLYKAKGVRGIFFEGAYGRGGGGSFADLQAYVMARLLWDPNLDVDALVREWHTGVYAQAALPMLEWFKLLHAKAADPKNHFVCFSNPAKVGYLTPEVIAQGETLFSRALALASAAGNEQAKEYVEKARLGLRYAKLYRDPTTGPEFTSLVEDLKRSNVGEVREHMTVDAWAKEFADKYKNKKWSLVTRAGNPCHLHRSTSPPNADITSDPSFSPIPTFLRIARMTARRPTRLIAAAIALATPLLAHAEPVRPPGNPPTTQSTAKPPDVRMRTPQETIASVQLPPGYRLELVAAEPQIVNPVCLAWDGNGAMYVAEMRTYMLDIDARGEKEPKSRVSRLESTRGDGVYDRVTTFADNLLLPRQILPLDDRILIRETDTKDIYEYRDTNGDGVAEPRTRFYEGGPATGNLEHQSAHLTWNIDNWMYQTVDTHRLRFAGGKLEVDKTSVPFKVGQWGYATLDDGRMIFATAGAEKPAHDFQVPLIYGKANLPGELADKFTECYPLVKFTDQQGGPGRHWPDGGLNRFTGTAGPSIYRGDALPSDLYGDYILPEPVGRLIRRAKVTNADGKTVLSKAEPGKEEFIISTDPNFRPVFTATGPDGCLYIVDMYHGIIQEGNWTREGSYLRKEILKYGLEKNVGAGRIYRLVHESRKPHFDKPRMLEESPAQLVRHLSHSNGWWRDTAQKLLVLKGDTSVVPALREMAVSHSSPLARLHALWTLDGLASADVAFVTARLGDTDPTVRAAAVRILETQIKANDPAVMAALKPVAADPDPNVVKQYLMSVLRTEHAQADDLIKPALDAKPKNTVLPAIVKALKESAVLAKADKLRPKHLNPRYGVAYLKGKDLFAQSCIACHGADGQGAPAPEGDGLTLAPPLKGSKRLLADKSVPIHIVLKGLVGTHENGKTYPNEMATFAWFDDAALSQILTYARNDWGNRATPVDIKDVRDLRKTLEPRTTPYTFAEITDILAKAPPAPPPAKKDEKKPAADAKPPEGDKTNASANSAADAPAPKSPSTP